MVEIASPAAGSAELRPMSGRRSALAHVREVIGYRELLVMLVRKELAVRYKNSVLGFTWSMLQPLFLLVVYAAVFAILGAGFARFAIWVLCGLLIWTLISSSMITATVSITSNASLVGKVKFPRAVLPLASVGGALVHFFLQILAFAVVLVIARHPVDWEYVWLLPIALVTCLIVCAALSLVLAPSNVYARDTMHLLELLVLGWFWATPILYEYMRAADLARLQGDRRLRPADQPGDADRDHVPARPVRNGEHRRPPTAPGQRSALVPRRARSDGGDLGVCRLPRPAPLRPRRRQHG